MTYDKHKEIHNQDLHKEHVDHNGSDKLDNCVPSCRSCNSTKRTIDFEYWYQNRCKGYTEERYNSIIKWLTVDHKDYTNKRL